MADYLTELAGGFLYGAVGIVLLVVGFATIDLLTPGKLGHLIVHERNRSAGSSPRPAWSPSERS